ncbi:MAG: CopG family transcriptional regulator [Burkholderiaceae bacterium]|nr:CopG family transcriptional regulator [Burkholderiaceae bacterium]
MRTTLDIDEDVLVAAKAMAQREGLSAGHVLSRLARQALVGAAAPADRAAPAAPAVAGFRPFASRGQPVSNQQIDRLRDSEGL